MLTIIFLLIISSWLAKYMYLSNDKNLGNFTYFQCYIIIVDTSGDDKVEVIWIMIIIIPF